jgi:putative intracellular protease/amidase
MSAAVDMLHPERPKRIVIVASNPAVSRQTGWPIGFRWAELTHPFWELTERGLASPEGRRPARRRLQRSARRVGLLGGGSDGLGLINSPAHMELIEASKPLAAVRADDYDGALLVRCTRSSSTTAFTRSFHEAGKVTAVICHATCVLLKTRLANGRLLVDGKTWTGFANSEERYADDFGGQRIQPFWIEDEARKLENTNFIVSTRFEPHAVRDRKWRETGDAETIHAVAPDGGDVGMPLREAYEFYGTARGQVPNCVNGYAVQSSAYMLPFDARGAANDDPQLDRAGTDAVAAFWGA